MVHDPAHTDAWIRLGDAYCELRRFRPAADCYRAALTIRSDRSVRFRLWFGLARAEAACGRLESAAEGYRRAVQLRPGSHEAWYNLGSVCA